jgi:hypothetical protein
MTAGAARQVRSGVGRLAPLLGPAQERLVLQPGHEVPPAGAYRSVLVADSWRAAGGGLAAQAVGLRALLRPGGVIALALDRPQPGLRRALRRAGLAAMSQYRVHPSLQDPGELTPRGGSLFWPWAARLVLASDRDARLPLLADLPPPVRELAVTRLWCSEKDKTLVFGRLQTQPTVLRLPHTPQALAAERHACAVLERLQVQDALARLLPRARQVGGSVFAETLADGRPLHDALAHSDRAALARAVEPVLEMLNPAHGSGAGAVYEHVVPSLLDRIAAALDRPLWLSPLAERLAAELSGAHSRLGLVHGDFSVSNVFVQDGRVSGLIDWENARWQAPPVLDALNYLDSVERHCSGVTLVQTLPRLAAGHWPISTELDLLRRAFQRDGLDWRQRRGIVMLYGLSHVVPQLGFAAAGDPVVRRLEDVVRWFIAGP